MNKTLEKARREADTLAILQRRTRLLLILFAVGLVLSGVTAFPLVTELNLLYRLLGSGTAVANQWPELSQWISHVHQGLACFCSPGHCSSFLGAD